MFLRRWKSLAVVIGAATILVSTSVPALGGTGGVHGPCRPGSLLEGETLGGDVSWVATHGFTPLPSHFAFEEGPPPMPPGQLLQFARYEGMC